jgi:CBS domain-containing protein
MATVREILARKGAEVVAVHPSDTVRHAADSMNQRGIGGVVVVENDELVGIFTERDVLRRVVGEGRDPAATPVAEVMTWPVITCLPRTSLEECAALMTARRLRHLPVFDGSALAGVVTIGDVLAFQVSEQQATIQYMSSYVYDLR